MPKIETQDAINLIANTLKLPPSDLTPNTHLICDLQLTDVRRMYLWIIIKKELHISLKPDTFLEYNTTVQDIINSINDAIEQQDAEERTAEQQAVEQSSDLSSNEHHAVEQQAADNIPIFSD